LHLILNSQLVLETIVAKKHQEVAQQQEAAPLAALSGFMGQREGSPASSMRRALELSSTGIIAEFKRRSPSKGWLNPKASVSDIVPSYERAGATACSILTDSEFFGGSFSDLKSARGLVKLPLLRKDFIVDEYQIYQSRVMGANAILLIAAILSREKCRGFARLAHQLGLEVLLEVHDEKELSHFNENVDMLGVNNRNLSTFQTDVATSFRMVERMKKETGGGSTAPLLVSESGISEPSVVVQLREVGFRGFLIGETFMKSEKPSDTLRSYIMRCAAAQGG